MGHLLVSIQEKDFTYIQVCYSCCRIVGFCNYFVGNFGCSYVVLVLAYNDKSSYEKHGGFSSYSKVKRGIRCPTVVV